MTDADAARSVGVVVVAAGSGTRLGAGIPKAFVRVGGRSLLAHAVDRIAGLPSLAGLIVVVPADAIDPADWPEDLSGALPPGARVVAGGAQRTDSVRAGLRALDQETGGAYEVILVHDAARAFTPLAVFERVIAAVRGGAAGAVPGQPVVDTIKVVDEHGVITGTPERTLLRAVQTPQGFAADVLRAAYASGLAGTDDAALVEALGGRVVVVEGDPMAFKVTTARDLERAERLLAAG